MAAPVLYVDLFYIIWTIPGSCNGGTRDTVSIIVPILDLNNFFICLSQKKREIGYNKVLYVCLSKNINVSFFFLNKKFPEDSETQSEVSLNKK